MKESRNTINESWKEITYILKASNIVITSASLESPTPNKLRKKGTISCLRNWREHLVLQFEGTAFLIFFPSLVNRPSCRMRSKFKFWNSFLKITHLPALTLNSFRISSRDATEALNHSFLSKIQTDKSIPRGMVP